VPWNLVDYHKLSTTNKFHPTGILGSVLGAIVVLLLRLTRLEKGCRASERPFTAPGRRSRAAG
jgi:hypothetical protein